MENENLSYWARFIFLSILPSYGILLEKLSGAIIYFLLFFWSYHLTYLSLFVFLLYLIKLLNLINNMDELLFLFNQLVLLFLLK